VDCDQIWRELKCAIRKQSSSDETPDEYIVETRLRQQRSNRIQVYSDHLVRLSDGENSLPQTITKADVIAVAKHAAEAPTHRFSIKDPDLKPTRMGSIICTMLALLPDFDYLPGQILAYRGGNATRNEQPNSTGLPEAPLI
jgi:hypothetical protein